MNSEQSFLETFSEQTPIHERDQVPSETSTFIMDHSNYLQPSTPSQICKNCTLFFTISDSDRFKWQALEKV